MSLLDFPLSILQHTPSWVWAVLLILLWRGLSQARPHRITLRRLSILPLVMLGLSLWGVTSTFGSFAALAAWAAGVLATSALMLSSGAQRGVQWSATEQHFSMPGSWLPLVVILGIFCTKFAVGVSLALHPGLHSETAFALGASLAYGGFSGFFAGRALGLARMVRLAPAARAA